jgi:hypothetical protein
VFHAAVLEEIIIIEEENNVSFRRREARISGMRHSAGGELYEPATCGKLTPQTVDVIRRRAVGNDQDFVILSDVSQHRVNGFVDEPALPMCGDDDRESHGRWMGCSGRAHSSPPTDTS